MLRGISRDNIDFITSNLAEELGFDKHLDKQIKAFSGGNKRKLSTALALLGGPSILLLDGPTTGMDPGAKRQFWNIVNKARVSGHSMILSSHSIEEIEALCTRLTIMVNGEFKCLGSTQYLKNEFFKGFLLTLKVSNRQRIQSVNDNIAIHFPNSVLKEQYSDHFTYHITDTHLKLSQIFGKIDKLKSQIEIADYSITETTLEQVFLLLGKK